MDRRYTPPKRVTSPTWGPPPPCKQALRIFLARCFINLGLGETAHLPLHRANINTYFSLRAKRWLRGGVGGQFPWNLNWFDFFPVIGPKTKETPDFCHSTSSADASCSSYCSFIFSVLERTSWYCWYQTEDNGEPKLHLGPIKNKAVTLANPWINHKSKKKILLAPSSQQKKECKPKSIMFPQINLQAHASCFYSFQNVSNVVLIALLPPLKKSSSSVSVYEEMFVLAEIHCMGVVIRRVVFLSLLAMFLRQ